MVCEVFDPLPFTICIFTKLCSVHRHMKDEQSKEIEDSVLDRCIAHGGVVHIYVDRRSPYVSTDLK